MSDSWMAWKPRIDDPSKPRPSLKTDSSNDDTGTVKCCITPGRSQKRTSIISTRSSWMYRNNSSLLANICPPTSAPSILARTANRADGDPDATLHQKHGVIQASRRFLTVSLLFQPCYVGSLGKGH